MSHLGAEEDHAELRVDGDRHGLAARRDDQLALRVERVRENEAEGALGTPQQLQRRALEVVPCEGLMEDDMGTRHLWSGPRRASEATASFQAAAAALRAEWERLSP